MRAVIPVIPLLVPDDVAVHKAQIGTQRGILEAILGIDPPRFAMRRKLIVFPDVQPALGCVVFDPEGAVGSGEGAIMSVDER